MKATTNKDMTIRRLYDNGDQLHIIAGNLNMTINQVEKSIIRTAQARRSTQPTR